MLVFFHQAHFCERGTSIALFDYANHNELILGNKSVILAQKSHPDTHEGTRARFVSRFRCLEYTDLQNAEWLVRENQPDVLYSITYGSYPWTCPGVRHVHHAVFVDGPSSGIRAVISPVVQNPHLKPLTPVVPHMVDFEPPGDPATQAEWKRSFRESVSIPSEAIVVGRYGGSKQFSVVWAREAVRELVLRDSRVWLLLMNTEPFCEPHPRIIHLPATADICEKQRFVLACDAMVHFREDGETFGLAVAEFSVCNRPVITTRPPNAPAMHLEILGKKALVAENSTQVQEFITNIKTIALSQPDWNAYQNYSPLAVMEAFNNVFLIPNKPNTA